uniref:Uncharacterized protein n=1 Tax=Strigops habroptila TaxID=2489341 RepID=A0A672V9Z4_STRHB
VSNTQCKREACEHRQDNQETASLQMCKKARNSMLITKVTQNNVTLIIYEFLQQVFQLFSKNLPAGVCNTSKIDKFQNAIHQQIEELETCLSEERSKARKNFQTWILKSTRLSVKKYFQRITSFLKNKQYRHCPWEAVQMELRTSLGITTSVEDSLKLLKTL